MKILRLNKINKTSGIVLVFLMLAGKNSNGSDAWFSTWMR
jgi:hypothetical protein